MKGSEDEMKLTAKHIDLDSDFSHYSERDRLACEQLQTKARELLAADAGRYEKKHPDVLLNAAAEALAPEGGQDRYSGIFACEGCGRLYHTDYSTSSDPEHDYCSADCQPERSHRKYD